MTALHHVHDIIFCYQGMQAWAYPKYSESFGLADFIVSRFAGR
jgi:hypothetical protein